MAKCLDRNSIHIWVTEVELKGLRKESTYKDALTIFLVG